MNKRSWFRQLERELYAQGTPKDECKEIVKYYEEMYRDKIEDGLTEKEVLREFGFPEDVADSVRSEDRRAVRKRVEYRDSYDDRDDRDRDRYRYRYRETPRPYRKRRTVIGSIFKALFTIIFGIITLVFSIAVVFINIACTVAGIAVMIAAFTLITQSMGAFVMLIGAGIMIIAIGGLILSLGHFSRKCFKRLVRGRA